MLKQIHSVNISRSIIDILHQLITKYYPVVLWCINEISIEWNSLHSILFLAWLVYKYLHTIPTGGSGTRFQVIIDHLLREDKKLLTRLRYKVFSFGKIYEKISFRGTINKNEITFLWGDRGKPRCEIRVANDCHYRPNLKALF